MHKRACRLSETYHLYPVIKRVLRFIQYDDAECIENQILTHIYLTDRN